ncbi:hypothetical protein FOZ63_019352 [Perkinsus olseni]|uniref:Uncharacterized protein n=1 Tax=Perkinsus olseni TaxID=32597 RepID=A0A7J6U6J1_PEROL|nr:hypothetical protein FOZ63_019352 [Perkinsus olseni]
MDALIIAKMLRFQNAECEMLDINNNPRMGDLGVKAIAEHGVSPQVSESDVGEVYKRTSERDELQRPV